MEYIKENVTGHEEYQVDTNGIVYGKNGNPLKPSTNHRGYNLIVFCEDGQCTTHSVHMITATQFIPNPENKPTVNHIDGVKTNNKIDNLEWATQKEQMQHAVNILGWNPGAANQIKVNGYDKNTGELKYRFDSLANAGRYFCRECNGTNHRYYQSSILRNIKGGRKSYKGCKWFRIIKPIIVDNKRAGN